MIPLFRIAARLDMHPTQLGRMLNEQMPMPAELARRVAQVMAAEKAGA
jgi:hypothetical protein